MPVNKIVNRNQGIKPYFASINTLKLFSTSQQSYLINTKLLKNFDFATHKKLTRTYIIKLIYFDLFVTQFDFIIQIT